ncbi:MAG: Sugar-phosphate isomerase, RpiB/LacA/LacB family [Candidatus Magasanikbacteria bacterium GW2011_GWC2_45_8]|uniref:Sugar-phosphate isomerase, RpiB/LacA/LacB family n=1 Tax=Candidatus Magasanikbacteria bacterium GW2011_GWC2_45_8 TaxID=1619050 RepID=A0A0G1N0M5_9BACT|nr:MAG: Sugar-phosphate isomerase, RpiB/LacA/LacB family [Candidatus Magasanikbacteria bacterium GW2011_GWC2_45_8]HBW73851.1 ribose 5-phosphate isomerase B [Candidatus Magasanikbacteria bacterium]
MQKPSSLYIGSDHAGFKLKEEVKKYLEFLGYKFEDIGAKTFNEKDDYPEFARVVAEKVVVDVHAKGILICGNGVGVCMAANKIKGIRAGIGYNIGSAKTMRADDDTNILCLAGRVLSTEFARAIVRLWLETPFSGEERHLRRLKQVAKLE